MAAYTPTKKLLENKVSRVVPNPENREETAQEKNSVLFSASMAKTSLGFGG